MAKTAHNAEDKRQRRERKHKRQRRFLIRLLVVMAVAAVLVTLVRYWNVISPDTLVSQIGNWLSGDAGEGFPVNVSGNKVLQMETADHCTVLLGDTNISMISKSGTTVMQRTHAFAEPLLSTAGKYMLIAERGGKRLQVEMRNKTVATHTTEYSILTATIHKSGLVAVVTAAQQGYNAQLSVYATNGELVYQRLCGTLLTDVAFSPDGRYVAVATVNAQGGGMRSSVEVYSIHSKDNTPLYSYSGADVLLCRIAYLSNDVIACVGDSAVWMYRPSKEKCDVYTITEGEAKSFAIGNSGVLLVTQPYGSSADGTVAFIGTDAKAAFTERIEGTCRDTAAEKDAFAVLTDRYIYAVNAKGAIQKQEIPADGRLTARLGENVEVLGLQNLSVYTF